MHCVKIMLQGGHFIIFPETQANAARLIQDWEHGRLPGCLKGDQLHDNRQWCFAIDTKYIIAIHTLWAEVPQNQVIPGQHLSGF